jgi:hypothetical protein
VAKNDPAQELRLAPLTREEAELTSRWRYAPELATYDGNTAAISEMLDPANRYHSIHLVGDYIGYVCVGPTPGSRVSRRWPASTMSGSDWLPGVSAAGATHLPGASISES